MVNLKKLLKRNKSKEIKLFLNSNNNNLKYFYKKELINNKRIVFNYYNFIKLNHNFTNKINILNLYFNSKKLNNIIKRPKEPLYINNLDTTFIHDIKEKIDNNLKVSIVMTIYNSEELLEYSLSSLLNQTYKNIEIILINDNSLDNSLEIIKKLRNNKQVKIINLKQNYGTYVAKNIGITFSTGELITFQDADDWAHPQRIEEHLKIHLKSKKVKFSISKLVRITKDGYFYAKEVYPLDRLSMVSLMIDKYLLDEIGYFRTHRLGSDTEYFERLKNFTSYRFKRIDKVLMFCSHRENSLTTSEETGVEGFAKNNKRKHYWNQWNKWHKKLLKAKRKPFVRFDRENYEYEIIE